MQKRLILSFLILILQAGALTAATDSLSTRVCFKQNETELDPAFNTNSSLLMDFIAEVKAAVADPCCKVEEILVRTGSSPEGTFNHNAELSRQRAESIRKYLQKELCVSDGLFRIEAVGEDWETLYDIVKSRYIPDKKEVMEILDSHYSYIHSERISVMGGPKKALMDLNGGRTWFWLLDNVFPDVRRAGNVIVCSITHNQPDSMPLSDTAANTEDQAAVIVPAEPEKDYIEPDIIEQPPVQEVPQAEAVEQTPVRDNDVPSTIIPTQVQDNPESQSTDIRPNINEACRKAECRLGTNVLYDIATVANLSLEIGFAKHVALNLSSDFSPWTVKTDLKLRTLLLQPELRYYFAKNFKGHYLGIEGHYGWYNVAFGGKTRYQDKDGNTPLWGAGLSYGYVVPLSDHWGIDFGISAGYANLVYDCFHNVEQGAKYTTVTREWWGPTRIGISIFYQF